MALHIGTPLEDEEVFSDINITPLVDVMLVLLIIFMITPSMLHQGIEVALPKSEAQSLPNKVEDPVVLSINRDGLIYLRDKPVHPTKLVEVLTPPVLAFRRPRLLQQGKTSKSISGTGLVANCCKPSMVMILVWSLAISVTAGNLSRSI